MRSMLLAASMGLLLAGCAGTGEMADKPESPPTGPPEDHWSKGPAAVPFMKIGRGVTNVVLSPFDMPATIMRVSKERRDVGYAFVAGTAEGIGNGVVRLFAGIIEILSFPLVNDADPFYERGLGERAIRPGPGPSPTR